MTAEASTRVRDPVDEIYRSESRRVFATLVRLLGDFDVAEEALHDAFRAALEQWPRDGVPANPRAWLVSAGRFKAIDGIRRRSRFDSVEDVADVVEAIRVGRLLVELQPDAEAIGLLALMLLQESRRAARSTPTGELILLDDQDRSLWNQEQIREGSALVERALVSQRFGPYTIQAAIAAVHADAAIPGATDWGEIVGLYDVLLRADPSPVIELNRAVAVAMRDEPAAGLALVDAILARGDLGDYHLAHAARADLCRRLGKTAEARTSYARAIALARQAPERRFLERRLAALPS